MTAKNKTIIYHVADPTDWELAFRSGNNQYVISTRYRTLEQEGFIHCSFRHQVEQIARRFYEDIDGGTVLSIDISRLQIELRVEPGIDTDEVYPHLYGPLNLDAVTSAEPFETWHRRVTDDEHV